MSDRCYIATRKGLFTVDRGASKWQITHTAFVGDNVTLFMHDPRNVNLFAALNHRRFYGRRLDYERCRKILDATGGRNALRILPTRTAGRSECSGRALLGARHIRSGSVLDTASQWHVQVY